MPIFWKFYQALAGDVELTAPRDIQNGLHYLARKLEPRVAEPTDECRASFYFAFNITPDEQVALEDYYIENPPVWCEPQLVENVYDPVSEIITCAKFD